MRLVVTRTSKRKMRKYFPQSEGIEFVEPTKEELESVHVVDWRKNLLVIKCKPKLMARMLFLMLREDQFPPERAFELY